MNYAHRSVGAVIAMASLVGVAAHAQGVGAKEEGYGTAAVETLEADAGDAIVVTAQRRVQKLQDVGIAVSAFSGEQLRTRQISSSIDVARMTPGVFASSSNGGQTASISIRGVTQNDSSDAVEGPVAVYVDETYVPSLQGQGFGLFDIERVEALKGPQGTLFGRNATGGLVNFVIAKPSDTVTGYANGSYGSFDSVKLEGAIGGPIAETVQGRISLLYNRNNGWLKNLYPGKPDVGGEDTLGGRAQLQWQATDALKVRATASAVRSDLSTGAYNSISTQPVFDGQGRVVGADRVSGPTALGFTPLPGSRLEVNHDFACSDCGRTRLYDAALHVDYDAGGAQISAITNWKRITKALLIDVDSSPVNLVDVGQNAQTESFSQELRATGKADRAVWNLGVYYLQIHTLAQMGFLARPNGILAGALGVSGTGADLANLQDLWTRSFSGFGQIEYKLAPRLSGTIGLRVIHEWQRYDFQSSQFQNQNDYKLDTAIAVATLQPSYANKRSDSFWAGKAALEYHANRDMLLYASINRGAKGGNYNSKLPDGSPPLSPDEFAYKGETLLAYEGGMKSTWLDGKATFNLSGFIYDYSNYQAFTFSNASGFVQNRDANLYGGEAEFTLRPVEGLELSGGLSLLHAKVKNVQVATGVYKDVRPTFAPKRQANGRISYRPPLEVAGGHINLAVDGYSTSSFYQNIRNFAAHKISGHTIFGAQVGWESASGFSLTGAVSNLFDKRYEITGFDLSTLCGCSEVAYGKPRWWTISAGFRF
ncbi:TonB-dependent receptor [Rhizorhabdus wittichii]|uniref:TonB-dependent receptor n=1 Tax=Rhizorhabdus wittichii TaxID=160791 RepID=UPI0002FCF0B9|nr:TonB-dependent receptor [Rhizorhabdus wittichii]